MKKLLLLILPILLLACSSSEREPGTLVVLTGMELVAVDKELVVGDKYQMKVNFTPSNVGNLQCEWKSSDTGVATVSQKGVVEVKDGGIVVITASYLSISSVANLIITGNQDYTSIVGSNAEDYLSMWAMDINNLVIGYKNEGKYVKIFGPKDIALHQLTEEIIIDESYINDIYLFKDGPKNSSGIVVAERCLIPSHLLTLKKKNGVILGRIFKLGIPTKVDKDDPTQYPQ